MWAAVEPFDRRFFRLDYSDVALLGKLVTRSRWWPAAGLALHAANGAAFGIAFDQLQRATGARPRRLALSLALAENIATFPLASQLERWHPASGEPGVASFWNARGFAQATLRHARVRDRARPARAVSVLPESRIVLAPLAGGPSTPELAAAVANAGGLPFLGAGYLTPTALADQLERTRALTGEPFGVNLFVLRDVPVDAAAVAAYADELQPEAERWGVELGEPRFDDDAFDAKLAVALAAGAAVVSFTFGCPTPTTSIACAPPAPNRG